jgi:regulator of vacuolar morphogenesis
MRCTPPLAVIERLASSKLISLPEDSRKARHQWEALITTADPHPAQIAVMDPQSVLELVKLLRTRLIRLLSSKDKSIVSRVGGWLWAVLGRCRDRGELSSEEIGELRQLAQRAIYIQTRVNIDSKQHTSNDDPESLDVEHDDGDSQDGQFRSERALPVDEGIIVSTGEDREEGSVEEEVGKAIDRDRLVSVTLDMVITVVGEVYGQRDLLESRRKWEERKIPT